MTTRKLLLFDFDGVLVESLDVYTRAIKWCLEEIGQPIVKTTADYLELFDDNFYEALQKKGIDLAVFGQALTIYRDIMGNDYGNIIPHSFMPPIIDALCKNHSMSIISSNSAKTIEEIFARHAYKNRFEIILGPEFAYSKKEKILYALDRFQTSPEDTYYIGDTVGDIKEGKLAGVMTVAVTWGWHPKEKLAAADPDYLMDSPEMLLDL
ncbi:MAG: HAD family hydrolase [Syntrophales bacterium]|nr:HAD family hydrolase [Syntrophales bacterium]